MIGNSWDKELELIWNSNGYKKFFSLIEKEYENSIVYPPKELIFNALIQTPLENVKAVIIGQDPYHEEGQAQGLSFSVSDGIQIPPSLINIFKELKTDLGIEINKSGNLQNWANEGVLLLNSILTVEKGKAGSHSNIGWEKFTDYVISILNKKNAPIVFILWGNYAKKKKELITNSNHLIIESSHPSPFSCKNFFGSRPFSKTNQFLIKNNITPINWEL